jgi:hypothetical protein
VGKKLFNPFFAQFNAEETRFFVVKPNSYDYLVKQRKRPIYQAIMPYSERIERPGKNCNSFHGKMVLFTQNGNIVPNL